MSQSSLELLPIRFDPQAFADHATKLNGQVATKAMSRLMNHVESVEPTATARLVFSRGLYGYPHVLGTITASVNIRCERCLDEFSLALHPKINLMIKPEQETLPENSENPDFYEYDGKNLTLSDLIEEELLLALPQVPKHEDISLCNQDMVAWLASNEAPEEILTRAENPFAILKR